MSQNIQLTQCLTGDQPPIDYVLTEVGTGKEISTIRFEKVGFVIAICRRSFDCLKILWIPRTDPQMAWSRNLFTNQEILELALIMANESQDLWQYFTTFDKASTGEPGKPNVTLVGRFIQMVENAFVGSSFINRLEFMNLAIKCAKHGFKEGSFLDMLVREASHFKYFIQWLNTMPMAECVETTMRNVKTLLRGHSIAEIKTKDNNFEHEMQRLNFIGRLRPLPDKNQNKDETGASPAKNLLDNAELEEEISIANARHGGQSGAGADRGGHQRGKNSNGGRVMFQQDSRDSAEAFSDG